MSQDTNGVNDGVITSLNLRVEVGTCAGCGAVYRTTGLTPDAAGRLLCVFCRPRADHKHTSRPAARRPGEPYLTQDEFIALYPTMSYQALAERCHVSPTTIMRWAKRLGIFTPRLPRRWGSDHEGGTT